MMPLLAIAALAAITYAFRIAGPLLADRVTVPATAQRLFTSAAAVLLVALAATSALTAGHDFAGWARPAGVAAAGLLAARRAPFPVVVLVAASVTALLRLAGIHLSERARGSSRPPEDRPTMWDGRLAVVAEDRFREGAGVVLEQPPALAALGEHRPGAVGQRAERAERLVGEAEQPLHAEAERRAVADHHPELPVGERRGYPGERAAHPVRDRGGRTGR